MKAHCPGLASLTAGWVYALVALLALPLGLSLALFPFYSTLVLAGAALALLCFFSPRPETTLLMLFLILQDPLQVLAGGDTSTALYIKRADEFMIVLVALGCLSLSVVRKAFRAHFLYLPILGCYVGLVLSSLVGRPGFVPASIDLVLFSKPFLLLAIGFSLAPTSEAIERYLPKLCLALTAVLSVAVVFLWSPELQYLYLGSVAPVGERVGLLVAQGFFINTGTGAWFAVATFCLSYAAFLTFSKRSYLAYSCLAAAIVVLTWRRKSILALAAVLLISLITAKAKGAKGRALLLLGMAAVLVVTILAPYLQALTVKTVEEYGSSDPYSTSRTALYYTSALIARDHFPLGTGLASFGSHASRLYYSGVYREYGLAGMYGLSPTSPFHIADTFWPMVLGQGGIISLSAYLCFLFLLGATALRSASSRSIAKGSMFLALASLFLLVGAFVESMASQLYSSSLQSALLFVTVGIYWRNRCEREAESEVPE
jgi:O-antigen ligase